MRTQVCVHLSVCACIYVALCVRVHNACTGVHIYVDACVCACAFAQVYVHLRICAYVYSAFLCVHRSVYVCPSVCVCTDAFVSVDTCVCHGLYMCTVFAKVAGHVQHLLIVPGSETPLDLSPFP